MNEHGHMRAVHPILSVVLLLLPLVPLTAERAVPGPQTKPAGAKPKSAGEPRFKAVFEPVNYTQDLALSEAAFATDESGWVAGANGTILFTKDGGKTWTAQLGGDLQDAQRPIADLRVVNDHVAFAAQGTDSGDHALLRTTDGESWTQCGTVGQHRSDFEFTSADTGAYLYGDGIFRTTNAGKSWTKAYTCHLSLSIEGLARDVSCQFEDLHFPTPSIGYAISRIIGKSAFAVAKSTDAGATWSAWPVEMPLGGEHVYFLDEQHGLAKMWGGTVLHTADGGKTWTAVAGVTLQGGKRVQFDFADSDVGWAFSSGQTLAFTTDGGRRWTSRPLTFPAPVNAFSLPSRRSGYVAGDHGMVYRYRIVPMDYTAPHMIVAPMMPASSRSMSDR